MGNIKSFWQDAGLIKKIIIIAIIFIIVLGCFYAFSSGFRDGLNEGINDSKGMYIHSLL